jgi:AbiV family abortive infection protein
MRKIDERRIPEVWAASVSNSKDLLSVADEAAKLGRWGIAASLVVTAVEELGKALALRLGHDTSRVLDANDPTAPGEVVTHEISTSVFDDHETKRVMILSIAPMLDLRGRAAKLGKLVKPIDPSRFRVLVDEVLPALVDGKTAEVKADDDEKTRFVKEFVPKFAADVQMYDRIYSRIRVAGLYVDLNGRIVSLPSDIDEDAYLRVRGFAAKMLPIVEETIKDGFPTDLVAHLAAVVPIFQVPSDREGNPAGEGSTSEP